MDDFTKELLKAMAPATLIEMRKEIDDEIVRRTDASRDAFWKQRDSHRNKNK